MARDWKNMKSAFATWNNRIAPLFDVCRCVHMVEIASGEIVGESEESLDGENPVQKVVRLQELGAENLICGAISLPFLEMVTGSGIRVIPFVAGELREVIAAWRSGGIGDSAFRMPGCRAGLRAGRARPAKEDMLMDSNRGRGLRAAAGGRGIGGGGKGGGRPGAGGGGAGGRGMGGGGRGGMGTGAGGACVCPSCGHTEAHQQGVPCYEKKCPQCGGPMTRQ